MYSFKWQSDKRADLNHLKNDQLSISKRKVAIYLDNLNLYNSNIRWEK